jgi:hypothetical protein
VEQKIQEQIDHELALELELSLANEKIAQWEA